MHQEVVITAALRTPIGSFLGALSKVSATDLASYVIKGLVKQTNISDIDELILGQVLQAGCAQAPARQALLKSDLSNSISATTINKVCGSGLKAIMLGHDSIALGYNSVVLAGGMESMSNVPLALLSARSGFRMGNQSLVDLITHDGLLDPFSKSHMGEFAEICAQKYDINRQAQDDYAKLSYEKALSAQKNAFFSSEIIELSELKEDEEPTRYKPEKISLLKPAFLPNGTISAANASKINDGAALVMLMSAKKAQESNIDYMAKIKSMATYANEPKLFGLAPVYAIKKALVDANLSLKQIDCFEINEAFSVVTMACAKELGISLDKVNIFGGAVALGHPIGASGARIVVTLLNVMKRKNYKYGVASICLGGGEALAVVIENKIK